jgi:hypothetical protein
MTVSSHAEHGLTLAKYRTFDWGPADALPTGDPRLDANSFFKDHLQGAVEKALTERGFELATNGAPDLLLHYHASITTRLEVNRTDQASGYCAGAKCLSDVTDYEAGTIVVDIIDAQRKTLIWRGWAQNRVESMLESPDNMAKTIDEAVRRMMQRLPPL